MQVHADFPAGKEYWLIDVWIIFMCARDCNSVLLFLSLLVVLVLVVSLLLVLGMRPDTRRSTARSMLPLHILSACNA